MYNIMEVKIAAVNVWFEERGFGFLNELQSDGTLKRYFLHRANILSGVPVKHAWAAFNTMRSTKGDVAINTRILASRLDAEKWLATESLTQATGSAR